MQMAAPAVGASGPWRMGGLGFGLPLSRLYARYFGATLSFFSDVYLTLG